MKTYHAYYSSILDAGFIKSNITRHAVGERRIAKIKAVPTDAELKMASQKTVAVGDVVCTTAGKRVLVMAVTPV